MALTGWEEMGLWNEGEGAPSHLRAEPSCPKPPCKELQKATVPHSKGHEKDGLQEVNPEQNIYLKIANMQV